MNTIVALSTPRGRGALAVIRLSGPDAIAIAQRMGLSEVEDRRATLTTLTRPNDRRSAGPGSVDVLPRAALSHRRRRGGDQLSWIAGGSAQHHRYDA